MPEGFHPVKNLFYHLPKQFVLIIVRSFWFVPAAIGAFALVAAILLNSLDRYLDLDPNGSFGWLYSNSPAGARALLSTISGSMITVTGVLLSAVIVVMSLASQQYGPRLVQNFIEDRTSQTVIGCFVGCFIYSVITLKTIQSGNYTFIPPSFYPWGTPLYTTVHRPDAILRPSRLISNQSAGHYETCIHAIDR
jgi:uncharacterized membrane protein